MHSLPERAETVAVATPCWPAPVSAMIRSLPMRSASSIWPRVLLILCAPVCARSSRLNQTLAPPHLAVRRSANIRGVGLVAFVGLFEFFEGVDKGLGHVTAPERSEVSFLSLLPQGRTSAPARHFSCPAHPPGNSTRPPRRARRTRPPRLRSPGRAR